MKRFLATLLIALSLVQPIALNSSAAGIGQDEDGNMIGPFKATDSFCQSFSTMGALLNAFQIVQWPVAGFPGVVMGLTQRTSIIHDVCDFLNQLSQLEGVNAVFFAGNYLNELTGKKWDHHLKMADKTWNLANTVYDFDNGSMRPGALTSESNAREMNDWMESAYSWKEKTFNNTDAEIKHRGERESEMQNFSRAAYQRAILQDAINCPEPQDNVNYRNIYEKQVKKQEVFRENAKEDVDFFRTQLMQMGPRFMNNDTELTEYIEGVEKLISQGIVYKMTASTKQQNTSKVSKNKDKEGHVIPKKEKVAKTYYKYGIQTDPRLWNNFKTRWSSQWATWIKAQWMGRGSFGALSGDAKKSVESEFVDLSYECNPDRLGRSKGFNRDAPNYDQQMSRAIEECKNSINTNEKRTNNLLEYYVGELQNSLTRLKGSNAEIWSVESEYAGINRMVVVKSTTDSNSSGKGGSFQQESVSCSDKLSPAEMELVSLKQQSVNNQLTQTIAENSMKQTQLAQSEREQKQEEEEEQHRKRMMVEQRNRDLEESARDVGEPFPVRGSSL